MNSLCLDFKSKFKNMTFEIFKPGFKKIDNPRFSFSNYK